MTISEDNKISLLEHLNDVLIEKYAGFKGADIKALLKRHIGPIFILGVDGRVVILSYRKGLVKVHVDYNIEGIVLRRRTTLFDKPINIEVAYRIIVAIATLEQIILQKESHEHVNLSRS